MGTIAARIHLECSPPLFSRRSAFLLQPVILDFPSGRCKQSHQQRVAMAKILGVKFTDVNEKGILRRSILQLIGFSLIFQTHNAILAAPMQEMRELDVVRTLKLPSGVRIQEITEGDGPEAHEGDIVEINYVCRRSNGYFVHSTMDQFSGEGSPIMLRLDDQTVQGLKEVLVGMKAGGKRRALIPPSVGYVSENLQPIPEEFGPRRSLFSHAKEPLVFEVQLLKVLFCYYSLKSDKLLPGNSTRRDAWFIHYKYQVLHHSPGLVHNITGTQILFYDDLLVLQLRATRTPIGGLVRYNWHVECSQ